MKEITTKNNCQDTKKEYVTPEIQVIELEVSPKMLQTSDKRYFQKDFD